MKPTPTIITVEYTLFWVLLALNLVPIWSVHYFLTGDGPCHLYNARVLLDFLHEGEAGSFYAQWMYLNTAIEPNWFSHATMALLMELGFQPFLAEKLLQTFYVLAFGLGLRFLIRQLNPNGLFLSTFGLLLTYHHVFQMGFYNYSCSLALMFWVCGHWLKFRYLWTAGRVLLQALGFVLLYFCHPIGLLFSFLIIGSIFLVETGIHLNRKMDGESQKISWRPLWKNALASSLAALPAILLFTTYVLRKGLNPSPRSESNHRIWVELRELSALINISASERFWAIGVAVLFGLLALSALRSKFKKESLRWTDVLFLVFGIALLLYFNQPGGIAGAGVLPIRLQLLPYLMLLLWLASVDFSNRVQARMLALTVIAFIGFMVIRIPHYQMASDAAKEYVSAAAVIPDNVSVLPISFDHNGRHASGRMVADGIWLFMHAGDYIGIERRVVMLGNYEAATHNFPLIWRWERNPFERLGKDGGYFEGQPPIANLLDYPKNAENATIDYVVTWCLDEKKFGDHPFIQSMEQQLAQGYDLVFTSENGYAKTFRRKGF